MLTTAEKILEAITLISGVEIAVLGETTEGLLLSGKGNTDALQKLVRHQSFIFQQQAEMLEDTNLSDGLLETLITLQERYHITRFLTGDGTEGLFLYAVLNRQSANLGMARVKLADIAKNATLTQAEREKLLKIARDEESGYYAVEPNPFLTPPTTAATPVEAPVEAAHPAPIPAESLHENHEETTAPGSPATIRLRRLGRLLHLSRRTQA